MREWVDNLDALEHPEPPTQEVEAIRLCSQTNLRFSHVNAGCGFISGSADLRQLGIRALCGWFTSQDELKQLLVLVPH